MKRDERLSYLMLFCSLLLVRGGRDAMSQSLEIAPLTGGAKRLAEELAGQTEE